jgi:hypothetical protein
MKKLLRTIKHYKLFFLALLASAAALGLQLSGQKEPAKWLLIAITAFELCPLLWGMYKDLRDGKYGVDILAATAIATAVIMGEYWAGVVIVLMLTGGEALEDYAEHRAERELSALLTQAPRQAHVLRGRKEVDVKASKPQELKMAIALIDQLTDKFDIKQYKDTYSTELMKLIEKKAKGKKVTTPKLRVVHSRSRDLMGQLKASLEKKGRKKAS